MADVSPETIEEVCKFLGEKFPDRPFHLSFIAEESQIVHVSNFAPSHLPHFISLGLSGLLEREVTLKY